MIRTTLTIQGMSCGHCVGAVETALRGLDGVQVEGVEIGSARIAYDAERVTPERIRGTIEEEGYAVRSTEGVK